MKFLDAEVFSGESPIVTDSQKKRAKFTKTLSLKGCKVTLNFLTESNGKTIDRVKKMLIPSQYRAIASKSE